jgi:hypothetical protein
MNFYKKPGFALPFVIVGLFCAVIDAYFSVQAIVGFFAARGMTRPSDYLFSVTAGILFTAFVSGFRILSGEHRRKIPVRVLWGLVFLVDLMTSLAGGIYYGALGNSWTLPIRAQDIRLNETTWFPVLLYCAFIALLMFFCVQLGAAFETLLSAGEVKLRDGGTERETARTQADPEVELPTTTLEAITKAVQDAVGEALDKRDAQTFRTAEARDSDPPVSPTEKNDPGPVPKPRADETGESAKELSD